MMSAAVNRPDEGISPRFHVLWPHAKGGLGSVYIAEDTELHRRVALKEIQPQHAADPVSRERFVAEAEITGSLEHPGVVPVYGFGTNLEGQPFYAMRFIEGEELTAAIRRFHAGTERSFTGVEFRWLMRKFIDVCNTVAYAHSRGVLHCDLKPSNIMIGPFGETLVMDWGIAKRLGTDEHRYGVESDGPAKSVAQSNGSLSASRSVAVTGQAVGTPVYMSPEQAASRLSELSPASDVFSLGATLYVLLTDRRPFDGERNEVIQNVQAGRFEPPCQFMRRLPKALDAICRRALAPQPSARYQSALELTADIERWLADEPVAAWRDTMTDRARRWLRRHQRFVAGCIAAVVVALLALVVAVPVLSIAWRNEMAASRDEQRQRVLALSKAAEAVKNENRADAERDRAEKTLHFLVDAFRRPDPLLDGRSIKVVDLLEHAVKDLDQSLGDQPLTKASLLSAIGETYVGLGMHLDSFTVFRGALDLRRGMLGEDHPDTLDSMNNLAMAYHDAGRFDKAIPLLEKTLHGRRARLGEKHADTVETMNDLAVAYWQSGEVSRAIPLYEEALASMRATLGEHHNDTLTVMDNLATAYSAARRHQKAIALHERVVMEFKATLGDDHVTTLVAKNNLARAYQNGGRVSDSISVYEKTRARLQIKLGDDHPTALAAMAGLARSYQLAGQLDRAISLYELTLDRRRTKLGRDHPETLLTTIELADACGAAAQPEKAIALARAFLDSMARNGERLPARVHAAVSRAERLLNAASERATGP
jgi:serine/threonine-protein kinase